MAQRTAYVIAFFAALEGAAGVILAAAAAHVDANPLLTTASHFLTMHAAAGLGLAALARTTPARVAMLAVATFALQAGVALFAADLASRVYLGAKLFSHAAPIGGGLTIFAWAAISAWGLLNGMAKPASADGR